MSVKAVAEIESVAGGGWGGDGFQTDNDEWQPERPDIQPATGSSSAPMTATCATIRVGEIDSNLDFDTDVVSGKINASWLSPDAAEGNLRHLGRRCTGYHQRCMDVDADGGSYTCDFKTVGWDLQTGSDRCR